MWLIRDAQCQALDDHQLKDFVLRMMHHLVINFGGELASTTDILRRLVLDWIRQARAWGLTQEEHVQTYVELCAEFPELREQPVPDRLAAILSWPGRPPEVKLERLQEELLFAAAEEELLPAFDAAVHPCNRCAS
jgi:hypothetical protein